MSLDLNMVRPGYRKLMLHGEQGEAVIVEAKEDRPRDRTTGIFGWKVKIRVKFSDGKVEDFDRYVGAGDAGVISVQPGDTVPVRMDSKKHRVEIDERALRSNRDAWRGQQQAMDNAAVRQTEERLGISEPSVAQSAATTAPASSIEDRSRQLDELHESGAISDEEYSAEQAKLIDGI